MSNSIMAAAKFAKQMLHSAMSRSFPLPFVADTLQIAQTNNIFHLKCSHWSCLWRLSAAYADRVAAGVAGTIALQWYFIMGRNAAPTWVLPIEYLPPARANHRR